MKTGRRPLISENGARTIGAMPNPLVKVVIPHKIATVLTFHSLFICSAPGLYAPAVKAVNVVAAHDRHIMKRFRDSDHSKGDVNLTRFGCSGGGTASGLLGVTDTGAGNSVSKVR